MYVSVEIHSNIYQYLKSMHSFQKLWKLCLSMENHLFLFFCSKTKFFIMASFISITVFIQIYVWIFLRLLWSLKADNIKMDWWQVARSKKTNEMLSAQIRVDDKFSNKHMFYTITGCFWYHLYSIDLSDIKSLMVWRFFVLWLYIFS